jgi:hypothetical protein
MSPIAGVFDSDQNALAAQPGNGALMLGNDVAELARADIVVGGEHGVRVFLIVTGRVTTVDLRKIGLSRETWRTLRLEAKRQGVEPGPLVEVMLGA